MADEGNNAVEKIPAGGSATSWYTIGSGFSSPDGVAVDVHGNVYVSDFGFNAIKEIPAAGGATVTLSTAFAGPQGVSIDASGNIFVAADYNLVKMIPANGGAIIPIASGYNFPTSVFTSPSGIIYVADEYDDAVKRIVPAGGYFISPALPLGLSFNSATGAITGTPVAASPATNYTITAYGYGGSKQTTVSIQVSLPAAPTVSYTTPQTYTAGTAITPLSPVSSGVTAPAYSTSTNTLGSGFNDPTGVALDAAGNIWWQIM